MSNMRTEGARHAVIYARVSSRQQEEEGFSIPAQLKLLRDYATQSGLAVKQEFVDVETAKTTGRPGFAEMVDFLTNHGARCRIILVEKTDRLYRNLRDYVTLDELDLEIRFVKENFILSDDSRSTEKFMHGIKVLMAKNYVDNLSEETSKGMREKAEQGIWPSFAPLGYLNVDTNGKRHIVLDSETAPLIRRLFELYATGDYSLLEVTHQINEEGLANRTSKRPVTKSAVHKMLSNPIYYGDFMWNGNHYQGSHAPIVSKELWDKVQQVLHTRGNRRTRHQKHWWAFQGLVSCAHCGCALVAEKKKGKYVYYHCTGNKGKCGEPWVREEELSQQFGDALKALHFDPDILEWVRDTLRASHVDEKEFHNKVVAELQKRYQKLQDRIDAMYVDKLDGNISGAYFEEKSAEWRKEQADTRRKIEVHEQANQSYIEEGIQLLELADKSYDLYSAQPPEEQRRLLNCVVSHATWGNGSLSPVYRAPFDLIAHSNREYACNHKGSDDFEAQKHNWLPGADSNHQPTG